MWYYDPEATVSQEFRERGQQQWGKCKRNVVNPRFLSSLMFRLRKTEAEQRLEMGKGEKETQNRHSSFNALL